MPLISWLTVSKGYKIDSFEFGNELCGKGWVAARVEAHQYGKDIIILKELVKELYRDPLTQPKVLGPAGFYDEKWFNGFLQASGPGVVDGLTHHIYNLGAGNDPTLINKIQDPHILDHVAQTYEDISTTIKSFGPWTGAWVGEAGGAYNSGGKEVSHTFVNGFCALLWHRLMGTTVLQTTQDSSPFLRVYSHCSKAKPGITLLMINMSNSTAFDVTVINDPSFYPEEHKSAVHNNESQQEPREEYHLTPKDGNILSDVVLLNGITLVLTESNEIPDMNPKLVAAAKPINVASDSIVFVALRGFNAPACSEEQQ